MKRILSALIVLVLVIVFNVSQTLAIDFNKVIVNDVAINIVFTTSGNTRTATIYENDGSINILEINDITGQVTCNGKPFEERMVYENNSFLQGINSSNWGSPITNIYSLSFVAHTAGAIVGYISLKYGVPPPKAAYIAGLIIGAGGFLYVKSVSRFNYVDYSPKVGYRLTETFHLDSNASDRALYTRTMSGSK